MDIVNRELERFVAKHPAAVRKVSNNHIRLDLPTNRRARKRALYAITQRLYAKNRSRACKMIVSGDWSKSGTGNLVSLEEMLGFWKPLLEQALCPDLREPPAVNPISWDVMSPVSVDEVRFSFRKAEKKTAPGLDGYTIPDLERIPVNELRDLFNLWLYSGCLPDQLCIGRTTLVLKEAGTTDPAAHRLITVSSVLVRQFHGILAWRLEASCPVGEAQKGFRRVDSCAENLILLRAAITAATNSKKPLDLFIAYLDFRKAFDSVSHKSLLLACKRIRVPEPPN